MLKNARRGTFIITEIEEPPKSPNMSGIDKQNLMRLRINRIALVQEIRIEHIIRQIMENGLIQEEDLKKVEKGTTPADKSRRLIDLVTTKTNVPEWYQIFREALLNPDGEPEVKRRYRELVEFLDNTVIHRPNSQQSKFSSSSEKSSLRLPHYPPLPAISNRDEFILTTKMDVLNLDDRRKERERERVEEMEKGMKDTVPETNKITTWSHEYMESQTLVKGYFQQWVPTPENYRSLVQVPEDHFQSLQDSTLPEDKTQLEQETQALEKIRKLELVAVMARRKLLPDGFELCMCDIVHDILYNPDQYHLYFKYLRTLQMSEVHLLVDIVKSFASVMTNLDPAKGGDQTQQGIKIGFHMIDFLADYGYFKEAELIMTVLLQVLNRSHNIETWMAKYKGYVKLMKLRNMNYEFMKVQMAYNLATEMTWQIKMMSFGQDIIDETEFNIELAQLMFEFGSASSSIGWAQKALRDAKESSPDILIHALCNGVVSYCAKWMIKKAEKLAIFTVQKALQQFGKRHPLYLKALLHFCFFSNEFKQDQAGLDTAKYTLETAQKIYGCDTIQVALSHRAVSKAMLALQTFDDPSYHYHASEGLKIARALLPENHPMLYLFLHTSATSLQWKALHSSKTEHEATLSRAEAECKEALDITSQHYGEISLRTGQMCLLLGQIYSKMDKILVAEEMLQRGVMYMKLCQPENSNFLLLAAATLGTFYKVFDKPREAIVMLKDVIKHLEPVGEYLKWIHVCHEHLISTLQSLNRNKEADEVQIQLSQWLRDNKVNNRVISLEELHEPPGSFSKFMDEFDVWDKTAKKILSLAVTKGSD